MEEEEKEEESHAEKKKRKIHKCNFVGIPIFIV
jgi:hypothetical protein